MRNVKIIGRDFTRLSSITLQAENSSVLFDRIFPFPRQRRNETNTRVLSRALFYRAGDCKRLARLLSVLIGINRTGDTGKPASGAWSVKKGEDRDASVEVQNWSDTSRTGKFSTITRTRGRTDGCRPGAQNFSGALKDIIQNSYYLNSRIRVSTRNLFCTLINLVFRYFDTQLTETNPINVV